MEFSHFSAINRERCESPSGFNHALDSWSLSDWMTATIGEAGEAANIVKKLNRVRDGIPGNTDAPEKLKQMLQDEIADTFIYLDLMAQAAGFSLESAVLAKFERTSRKIGYIGDGLDVNGKPLTGVELRNDLLDGVAR
jgi:NTP pyrophosphatase (non-canonical NTP hydrolase)